MLDLGRYLLGVADLALLLAFATLGATALRARLLPGFGGAPAHLATAVLALALLLWTAELLGAFGLFHRLPHLLVVIVLGTALRLGVGGGCKREACPRAPSLLAFAIAAIAVARFAIETKAKLGTGMTGFDSTWYHGPLAAEMFQSGDTWSLHFIAPQFLAWLYPANSELFHAIGMQAFDRDLLSPLLNLGWFAGCLVACWCIGRPYGVAPWSLALGAVALSLPAFADQAGEARNDIVGAFFLLAAVAIASNAYGNVSGRQQSDDFPQPQGGSAGAAIVAGLAVGLAAGTKLNFLLPAAVLVVGIALAAPAGARRRALGAAGLAGIAGGGYWYLRNLVQSGNPLPWVDSLGPLSLPGPDQPLGGREGHSVLGYLTDGAVWSDWFLPGLAAGLSILWPLVLVAALAGLLLAAIAPLVGSHRGSASASVLALAGLTGLAAALAWLLAPTSASGPEGMPRGFESGLRYLVPALVLGSALLPAALGQRFRRAGVGHPPGGRILKMPVSLDRHLSERGMPHGRLIAVALIAAIAIGYPLQRHYLDNRYANPTFAAPGLNAAFEWARDLSGVRIAATATRLYPLYGTDLSNDVRFVGEERPQGGFLAPTSCRQWRRLLSAGDPDYVVASRDRLEPGRPPYSATARWTEAPGATEIFRRPPTIVYRLTSPLSLSACP